jgi:hypothetical protein
MSNIDFYVLLSSILGIDEYEVGGFGESIHDHPNQVNHVGSQQQARNEVDANVFLLPS